MKFWDVIIPEPMHSNITKPGFFKVDKISWSSIDTRSVWLPNEYFHRLSKKFPFLLLNRRNCREHKINCCFLFQVFQGNFDNDTHRKNVIDPPIYARFIRILPWSWYGRITLRVEILGCTEQEWCLSPLHLSVHNSQLLWKTGGMNCSTCKKKLISFFSSRNKYWINGSGVLLVLLYNDFKTAPVSLLSFSFLLSFLLLCLFMPLRNAILFEINFCNILVGG